MRPQLLHLSGPDRGRTATFPNPVVTIGSADGNDAKLDNAVVAPHHARIEWVDSECLFHLRRQDGQVFVNGTEVEEVILQDGDEIEFGADGPRARFRVYVPPGAVCKPVRRMLADARDVARVSGNVAATRTLTRDLLTQATMLLKVGVPLVVVISAFLAGWLGGWLGSRPSDKVRADSVTRAELDTLRRAADEQHEVLQQMAKANATVRRIQKDLGRGVCLFHGVVRVRMPDGKWLQRGSDPYELEYTGSGFLASRDGHIVTNRHVVVPWLEVPMLGPLLEQGATAEFTELTVTFPGKAPVAVPPATTVRRTDEIDVAVVQVGAAEVADVPVLAMHRGPLESDDQRAFVVGYPLGLATLLARADPQLVEQLRKRSATYSQTIEALAAANQVTPLITQGIISEERDNQIVYDASTTFGGSGGPVFGGDGDVIAVNAAVMQDYVGANFGVPIRFAIELLPTPR